jgi:hypothetical protein
MSLADLRILLDDRLRETAGHCTTPQKDGSITEALKRYSLDFPADAVDTITGDGVTYTFPLPAGFEEGFSTITAIEYPLGQQVPAYLDPDTYSTYRNPTTGDLMLRLYSLTLAVGEQAGICYTGRHTVTETEDTVPASQQELVAWLAAAICCRQLAAYYAQTMEPMMGADAAYWGARAQYYLTLAEKFEQVYSNEGTMTGESLMAASVHRDLDVTLEYGLPRFYHPSRYR